MGTGTLLSQPFIFIQYFSGPSELLLLPKVCNSCSASCKVIAKAKHSRGMSVSLLPPSDSLGPREHFPAWNIFPLILFCLALSKAPKQVKLLFYPISIKYHDKFQVLVLGAAHFSC